MLSDLKTDIDGIRLNIRVGAVMRYNDEIVMEISKIGANSTIPGGRIKINEKSVDALKREAFEEMGLDIDIKRAKQLTVFENFFKIDEKPFHEIYFLYEYLLNEEEVNYISTLTGNKDNETTFFKLVNKFELEKYNLLPLSLHPIIQK